MNGLAAWVCGCLILTVLGLFLARRWLDRQDRTGGPP